MNTPHHAPLLIALPDGLNASGVTTWAVRLTSALAARGRPCGLIIHAEPPGQRRIDMPIHPRVAVFDLRHMPRLDDRPRDLSPHTAAYRDALRTLAPRPGAPVALSPNLIGECYTIAAAIARSDPHAVRILAVHHSDLPYNDALCAHFEPMVHAFVGVSSRIAERLRSTLAPRAADVYEINYGVEIPPAPAPRPPLAGRPLRLLYTGRVEHEQKRIRALLTMSDELNDRAVTHELAILGDGPAADEIDADCAQRPSVLRLHPRSPAAVAALLDAADLFVLASRYEGLSVSILEAMARGCAPVAARTASGATQQIDDGRTGVLVEAPPDAHHADTGARMADGVQRALRLGPAALGLAAWADARSRFSLDRTADAYARLADACAAAPPRPWPADRPAAFSPVPPDAAERVRTALAALAGRRILIHGVGRHTADLAHELDRSPANIVAYTDDDPARHGTTFRSLPILDPAHAAEADATDVLISSWLHEEAIWSRRAIYERQGLRVHRLYTRPTGTPPRRGARRSTHRLTHPPAPQAPKPHAR